MASRRTDMPRKRYKQKEIVAKLRQVVALVSRAVILVDAVRQSGRAAANVSVPSLHRSQLEGR